MFQFEIGVQSTNEKTLDAVGRQTDFNRLSQVTKEIKSYRNIHDFVLLMKEIDISLGSKPQTYFEEEEFLTKEDFRRSDTEILDNYHNEKFDSYVDGNDFIKCHNKTEIKNAFKAISKKLILPKGDGDK